MEEISIRLSQMAFRIWSVFKDHAPAHWRESDALVEPTPANVNGVLIRALAALKEEPDQSSYELGGIIVRKDAGHIDVYAYLGEINVKDQ